MLASLVAAALALQSGGVRVASGDVNGDGIADIVTGAEAGPHVKAFDGTTGAPISATPGPRPRTRP